MILFFFILILLQQVIFYFSSLFSSSSFSLIYQPSFSDSLFLFAFSFYFFFSFIFLFFHVPSIICLTCILSSTLFFHLSMIASHFSIFLLLSTHFFSSLPPPSTHSLFIFPLSPWLSSLLCYSLTFSFSLPSLLHQLLLSNLYSSLNHSSLYFLSSTFSDFVFNSLNHSTSATIELIMDSTRFVFPPWKSHLVNSWIVGVAGRRILQEHSLLVLGSLSNNTFSLSGHLVFRLQESGVDSIYFLGFTALGISRISIAINEVLAIKTENESAEGGELDHSDSFEKNFKNFSFWTEFITDKQKVKLEIDPRENTSWKINLYFIRYLRQN